MPISTIKTGKSQKGIVRAAAVETLERRMLLSVSVAAQDAAMPRAIFTAAATSSPSVVSSTPTNGATNVDRDTAVTLSVHLPNGALDASTVNATNVALQRNSDGSNVGSVVNTTGGGDAIVLTPFNI